MWKRIAKDMIRVRKLIGWFLIGAGGVMAAILINQPLVFTESDAFILVFTAIVNIVSGTILIIINSDARPKKVRKWEEVRDGLDVAMELDRYESVDPYGNPVLVIPDTMSEERTAELRHLWEERYRGVSARRIIYSEARRAGRSNAAIQAQASEEVLEERMRAVVNVARSSGISVEEANELLTSSGSNQLTVNETREREGLLALDGGESVYTIEDDSWNWTIGSTIYMGINGSFTQTMIPLRDGRPVGIATDRNKVNIFSSEIMAVREIREHVGMIENTRRPRPVTWIEELGEISESRYNQLGLGTQTEEKQQDSKFEKGELKEEQKRDIDV